MSIPERLREKADSIREAEKYGHPAGPIRSTCSNCHGNDPEHDSVRPTITAVVLEIDGERVTFERRPF